MYGLGKALLAGSQAFTDARDQQLAREKTRQQMERAALEMALMKDEEQRAKEKFTLDSDNANLKLAHDLASSFEDQSLVPEEVGARFKGTPGEMFFKPDQTLDSKALTGIGQLIGGNTPMQAPTETASPGQLTGKGFRSQLPIDSKAALQTAKLQSDLTKAQAGYYQRALDRDSREGMNAADNNMAYQIALVRAAASGNRGAQQGANDDTLVAAIMDHPEIMDQLSTTVKARIIPKLSGMGFDQFGKPMTSSEIGYIAEQKNAREGLAELLGEVKANKDKLGPAMGFLGYIPYSDSRALRARIDTIRQRVGKALEGGVLRKEDEAKYRQQLATLFDEPELAVAKIEGLLRDFDRDVQIRQQELRSAGRRVPGATSPGTQQAPAQKTLVVKPDGSVGYE